VILIKPQIISASRRTDIPAFYSEWFINRVRQGWGIKYNPYNKKIACVSLTPENVAAVVFWSKNYTPLLPYLEELDKMGYNLVFHFTITGLPRYFEENVPPPAQALEIFKTLAKRYSPEQVLWRYDPVILTHKTDCRFHLENFTRFCTELAGFTKRCYISYINVYGKVERRLKAHKINLINNNLQEQRELANSLAEVAQKYEIELFSCCNDFLLNNKIKKARCIDANLLQKCFGIGASTYSLSPSRKECGCYESIDLGLYDTCLHGCLYCYANNREGRIKKNYELYEPGYPALHKGIDLKEIAREEGF